MTLLVDWEIRRAVEDGLIGIDGFNPDNLGPNSYDITLDSSFIEFDWPYKNKIITPGFGKTLRGVSYDSRGINKNFIEHVTGDLCIIYPNELLLGSTVERFKISPGIVAFVHGRSSWARIGLQIHAAGLLDSGWEGNITLEIVNFAPFPIILRKGDKIGQVTFDRVAECEVPYYKRGKSKYDRQVGATESRLWKDYNES
jgi:dCTP deaminase